ncbi:MAG: hypothetical protein E6R08_00535 [Nevskiaceae bacterium]|nr:MAG: hypothetical protein E6R08_00535 [Nevskiaceae bacterium]
MLIELIAPGRPWFGRGHDTPALGDKTARDVAGVQPGVIGQQQGVLDCNQLARVLPGVRNSREGGFRDAIESMALALQRQGVDLRVLNSAVTEVLDAYANNN